MRDDSPGQVPEVRAPATAGPSPHPWPERPAILGGSIKRLDGPLKAQGRAKYAYDLNRPGMLHARIVRSPHAHARVVSIDLAEAQKAPGVRAAIALRKDSE